MPIITPPPLTFFVPLGCGLGLEMTVNPGMTGGNSSGGSGNSLGGAVTGVFADFADFVVTTAVREGFARILLN